MAIDLKVCFRCTTPGFCSRHGCCPGTVPSEVKPPAAPSTPSPSRDLINRRASVIEMVYLLQIVPRGEDIPWQIMEAVGRQFDAAMLASQRAQAQSAPSVEPFAHLCIINTDAGRTKFFTSPSDPRGFPVYLGTTPTAQPAPTAPEWRPIETAPRGSGQDGPNDTLHADYVRPPRLFLWTQEGPMVGYYDWFYHPGYGRGAEPDQPWRNHEGGPAYGVTHWMPIPAAPQEPQR